MKRAFITGVTGQDGAYLAAHLLNQGYSVVGMARRCSIDNTHRVHSLLDEERFTLVRGDVADGACMGRLLREHAPDEVYNLAAMSQVGDSFIHPKANWDVTFGGALNCLEAIRDLPRSVRPRYYQASSSEMFGSSGSYYEYDGGAYRIDVEDVSDLIKSPHLLFQDESTPMRPRSPYAAAKLAAHHLVDIYRKSYDIFACSGILFNHESEVRGKDFVTRKITNYFARLVTSPNINTFPALSLGNLQSKRDWSHAADMVRGMHLMLQQEEPDDYVLATGQTWSVWEFVHECIKALKLPVGIFDSHIQIDPNLYRPNEVHFLCGDASKARAKLGWEPKVDFHQLVRRMLKHDLAIAKGRQRRP